MSLNDHKECVQTAESLQPPPDSGHVRRSSDVGLESRTGAQRRRSMAPGLEGGSGGSATSLHRSSSMKQQRSGSFNTGALSKLVIWQQKRSAKQLPSIILIALLIFKAIHNPGRTKFPTFFQVNRSQWFGITLRPCRVSKLDVARHAIWQFSANTTRVSLCDTCS